MRKHVKRLLGHVIESKNGNRDRALDVKNKLTPTCNTNLYTKNIKNRKKIAERANSYPLQRRPLTNESSLLVATMIATLSIIDTVTFNFLASNKLCDKGCVLSIGEVCWLLLLMGDIHTHTRARTQTYVHSGETPHLQDTLFSSIIISQGSVATHSEV